VDSISRRELLLGTVVPTLATRLGKARNPSATARDHRPPQGDHEDRDATESVAKVIPFLHCTDLFRPFADPDDHFDLASVYALAQLGHFDLRGILIDFPPEGHKGDPDVQAVAQMNMMTGLSVPVMIGSANPFRAKGAVGTANASSLRDPRRANGGRSSGALAILTVLKESSTRVVINIAGSSRDVATAAATDPQLFARKCKAVYLNAGSGTEDPMLAKRLEYNVALDPASYAAIFTLPCPVYWLPCFEAGPMPNGEGALTGPHSSLYTFTQQDLLPTFSDRLQNYFAFAYRQGERNRSFEDKMPRANWLHALEGNRDDDIIAFWGKSPREMWCTAGLLHAAGLTVGRDGTIVPLASDATPLYTFDPVRVECGADGVTTWTSAHTLSTRFMLTVRDEKAYPTSMTRALGDLLRNLS
jgi:hypothetical protein